jgi:hypothetical protein
MDKLQWFKFAPSDWMMGKIMRCEEITQARFIRLCCLYWNKETDLLDEDARIEIDDIHFESLIKKKVIISDGVNVSIDFLDEQFDNVLETSKKASKAGKASAAKRKAIAEQLLNDRSTTVQRNPTDKIREDKIQIREDNIENRKREFKETLNPHLEDYGKDLLNNFFGYWTEHGEKDKKMRFEKEKSFGLSRRLTTWKKNDDNFKPKKDGNKKTHIEKLNEIL